MANSEYSYLMDHYRLSDEDCNKPVSKEHFEELSSLCEPWRKLPQYVGLKTTVEGDLERDFKTEEEKRVGFIKKWKERNGFDATYKMLIEALLLIKSREHAEGVFELLVREKATPGEISTADSDEIIGNTVTVKSSVSSTAKDCSQDKELETIAGKTPGLAEILHQVGLDKEFWLHQLGRIGVKSVEALRHLEGDTDVLSTLERAVRHSWEKKPLRELLKILKIEEVVISKCTTDSRKHGKNDQEVWRWKKEILRKGRGKLLLIICLNLNSTNGNGRFKRKYWIGRRKQPMRFPRSTKLKKFLM